MWSLQVWRAAEEPRAWSCPRLLLSHWMGKSFMFVWTTPEGEGCWLYQSALRWRCSDVDNSGIIIQVCTCTTSVKCCCYPSSCISCIHLHSHLLFTFQSCIFDWVTNHPHYFLSHHIRLSTEGRSDPSGSARPRPMPTRVRPFYFVLQLGCSSTTTASGGEE